jgi:hypothetical protein|tara:strand:+ start:206 stop:430 length:225 start_codon:yes stop_codon:yes gene_type:complete
LKEFDEVTDRLTTELNFLTEEGKQSIVIAEAALNAAMVFTIAIAPTPLLGIQMITKVLHTALCVVAEQSLEEGK